MTDELPAEASSIDVLAARMLDYPIAPIRSLHQFTPGIYVRGCEIPPNTLLITELHLTEHPFVITKGEVWVWSENEGLVLYRAPHIGITKPGTRRVLWTETGAMWTCFHATEETDVEKIGAAILGKCENPLIPEDHPALHQWLAQIPNSEHLLKPWLGGTSESH